MLFVRLPSHSPLTTVPKVLISIAFAVLADNYKQEGWDVLNLKILESKYPCSQNICSK